MPEITTENYWSQRYREHNTPWDMGSASPPLTAFLQRLNDKTKKILIPGAGNAYEAEWLWKNAFSNTYVVDIAREPLEALQKRIPDFPSEQLLHMDFFDLDQQFDLIIEQTFFCALPPDWRERYSQKMHDILKPGGQIFGVLFDFPLTEQGPPFGGNREEYQERFAKHFKIHKLERCYNSIAPRQGNEVFFRLLKG